MNVWFTQDVGTAIVTVALGSVSVIQIGVAFYVIKVSSLVLSLNPDQYSSSSSAFSFKPKSHLKIYLNDNLLPFTW